MGTTDKTNAIRQKRFRERRAQALAKYEALQAAIALIKELQVSDAEKWRKLEEKTKGL